jgi:hypothetical protein
MSFAVVLTELVRRRIGKWKLSGRLQSELLERIYEELASSPIRYLRRLEAPADVLDYSFIVESEGDPPYDYLFTFSVLYAADEETIIVWDCDYLSINSG